MPPVVVAIAVGAGVGAAGAFFAGTAILTAALVGGALAGAQYLLAPKPKKLGRAGSAGLADLDFDTRGTVVAGVEPARWVVGRARLGGSLKFYQEVDERELWLAFALSEGACEAIEKVWIDGTEVALSRTGTHLQPIAGNDYRDKIHFYEYFAGDGTQGAELRAGANEWTNEHRLAGLSWVAVHLVQPDYGTDVGARFWTRRPEIQYLVKGLKLTWPGQATPVWTESAAAIRYWYESDRVGIPAGAIDNASVRSAHTLCSANVTTVVPNDLADYTTTVPRYSVNGVITSAMSPSAVRAELDFCWQGWAVEKAGVLYFRPGADRAPAYHLVPDDVIAVDGIRPAPAVQDRTNALSMSLSASADHAFLDYDLPERVDADALARDRDEYLPDDLGERGFVAYPVAAARLVAILLRRGRSSMTATVRIKPGDGLERYSLVPSDWITLTLPEYGFDQFVFSVRSLEVNSDLSLTLTLDEKRTGDYVDSLDLPPLRPRDIAVPDPRVVPALSGLTLDEVATTQSDGSILVALDAAWDSRAIDHTELELRMEGSLDARVATSRASSWRFDGVRAGETWEARARHVNRLNLAGPWSAWVADTVDGDLTPPGVPAGYSLIPVVGGYQAQWTPAPETDYQHTEVWQGASGDPFAGATRVATIAGSSFTRLGFAGATTRRVWLRHVDRSANEGATVSRTVTTDTPAAPPAATRLAPAQWFVQVNAAQAAQLITQGASLNATFAALANAATEGANITGDVVTFLRSSGATTVFSSSWTWTGATWGKLAPYLGAELLVGLQAVVHDLTVNVAQIQDLSALRINANQITAGVLAADHISADVKNFRLLWSGYSTVVDTSVRSITVSENLNDFDSLYFELRDTSPNFQAYGSAAIPRSALFTFLSGASAIAFAVTPDLPIGNPVGTPTGPSLYVWRSGARGLQLQARGSNTEGAIARVWGVNDPS